MASFSVLAQYSGVGVIRLIIRFLNFPLNSLFRSAIKSCLQKSNLGQVKFWSGFLLLNKILISNIILRNHFDVAIEKGDKKRIITRLNSILNASEIAWRWALDRWQTMSMMTCSFVPSPFIATRLKGKFHIIHFYQHKTWLLLYFAHLKKITDDGKTITVL